MANITKIESFLLHSSHLAPNSIRTYRWALDAISNSAWDQFGKNLEELDEDEIIACLNEIKNPQSWNKAVVVIRKFCLFCGWELKIKQKRVKQKYNFLDWNEQHTQWMIEACLNLRDQAMIAVLCECGFRRSELVSIKLSGVEFCDNYVRITCTDSKTVTRTVPGIQCMALLAAWIDVHPRKTDPAAAFFCAIRSVPSRGITRGEPVKPSMIAKAIEQIERRAKRAHPDLPHFHPHKGRHVAATSAARKRMGDSNMMEYFGWRTAEMPHVYSHLVGKDAERAFLTINGMKTEDDATNAPRLCPSCGMANMRLNVHCAKCGSPMNRAKAQKLTETVDSDDALIARIFQNPKLKAALKAAMHEQ